VPRFLEARGEVELDALSGWDDQYLEKLIEEELDPKNLAYRDHNKKLCALSAGTTVLEPMDDESLTEWQDRALALGQSEPGLLFFWITVWSEAGIQGGRLRFASWLDMQTVQI
jgi:hypothetical protein